MTVDVTVLNRPSSRQLVNKMLCELSQFGSVATFGTMLRDGEAADYAYIDSLRKKEGSALGFIPKDAYLSVLEKSVRGGRARYRYQRLLVTTDNGDLTGFCYASYADNYASIIQIVVQQDARRWHRALMMAEAVENDARTYGKHGVTCRVAYDLESNFFWRATGYLAITKVTSTWLNQKESKSKRPLWVYRKYFEGGLFALASGNPTNAGTVPTQEISGE